MNKQALRYGLVGAGWQGRKYRHYIGNTGRIVALVDSNPDSLAEVADELGVGGSMHFTILDPAFYQAIDVAIVATPPDIRTPVLDVLRHDTHVICENPLTTSQRQLIHIQEEADRRNLVCTVNEQWRFLPSVVWAKQQIAMDRIGDIKHIRMGGKGRDADIELVRVGSHLLSVVFFEFNPGIVTDVSTVTTSGRLNSISIFSTMSGIILTLELLASKPVQGITNRCFIEVIGTKGRIRIQGGLLENCLFSPVSFEEELDHINQPQSGWNRAELAVPDVWTITAGHEEAAILDANINPTFWLLEEFAAAVRGEKDNPYPSSTYDEVAKALEKVRKN